MNAANIDYLEYCESLGFDPYAPAAAGAAEVGPNEARAQVRGDGNPQAVLMFVGEALGPDGDPGAGPAGALLAKMIQAMGYRREDVYIATLVTGRPAEDPDPESGELAAYLAALQTEIEGVGPRAVVALGTFAARIMLASEGPLATIRGQAWPKKVGTRDVTVFPTFHPAYVLRHAECKKDVWEDLQQVIAFLKN